MNSVSATSRPHLRPSDHATASAQRVLRKGDLLEVRRWGGEPRVYRWTGRWCAPDWLVCRPRLRDHLYTLRHFRALSPPIDDVHPLHICRVNGCPVDLAAMHLPAGRHDD